MGKQFAEGLHSALYELFADFGDASQQITNSSHIEKVCLVSDGVGRDNISDFTTNLIKEFLLAYTQDFARDHLRPEKRRRVVVDKVRFSYRTETWERDTFELPYIHGDYVLLTPREILTRDEAWINRADMIS